MSQQDREHRIQKLQEVLQREKNASREERIDSLSNTIRYCLTDGPLPPEPINNTEDGKPSSNWSQFIKDQERLSGIDVEDSYKAAVNRVITDDAREYYQNQDGNLDYEKLADDLYNLKIESYHTTFDWKNLDDCEDALKIVHLTYWTLTHDSRKPDHLRGLLKGIQEEIPSDWSMQDILCQEGMVAYYLPPVEDVPNKEQTEDQITKSAWKTINHARKLLQEKKMKAPLTNEQVNVLFGGAARARHIAINQEYINGDNGGEMKDLTEEEVIIILYAKKHPNTFTDKRLTQPVVKRIKQILKEENTQK